MCRWGCTTTNTTYMCKWCGTRYCKECLKGDFVGEMVEPTHCRICNQKRCQGNRVEYVPKPKEEEDPKKKGVSSSRGRSAGRSAKAKGSAKSTRAKSGKSAKSGKKSGKKKKKK